MKQSVSWNSVWNMPEPIRRAFVARIAENNRNRTERRIMRRETFYVMNGECVADFGQNTPEAVLFAEYLATFDKSAYREGGRVKCVQLSLMQLREYYTDFVMQQAERGV